MPFLTANLAPNGPLVDLFVGVSVPRETALRASQQPVPQLIQIRALIDTGASCTCIDPTVLNTLGLSPRGTIPIHTPSTLAGSAHTANQYDVCIILSTPTLNFRFGAVPVIDSQLLHQGIQGLIGRDILQNCLFTYNGPANIFLIGF